MKKIRSLVFASACMLIIATSCSVNDNGGSNPEQGLFLLANISPDAPPLSVNINGSPFGAGLYYGNYTPYYSATAGSYDYSFYGTGTASVLSNIVNIAASKRYSYFVIDSFSTLKSSFVEDNLIQPSSDSVYVRFFNFSPDAGAVNLKDSTSDSTWYSTRYFNDEASNPSYANFTRVQQGVYTFEITKPDGTTVLATRKDTLVGGHIYSIFAKGFAGVGAPVNQAIGVGQLTHF